MKPIRHTTTDRDTLIVPVFIIVLWAAIVGFFVAAGLPLQ